MKFLLTRSRLGLFAFFVVFFQSCSLVDPENPDDFEGEIELSLFDTSGSSGISSNSLRATIRPSEDFHMAFFGQGNQLTSVLLTDENTGMENVILLNEAGVPAFSYVVNTQEGSKAEGLIEFEEDPSGGFFIRYYHYNWEERIGTLLLEQKVMRTSGEWDIQKTFETSNMDLDGIRSRVNKGGGFYTPIPRLDKLNNRMSRELATQDLVQGFMDQIDNFRQNDIGIFLRDTVSSVGFAGIVVGGLGVIAGSPAAGVVFLAGSGLAIAGRGIDFFLNDGWEQMRNEYRDRIDSFNQGINDLQTGTVEILDSFSQSTSDYWSSFTQGIPDLEEFLRDFEEDEILLEAFDLDDLPDDDGVVHVGLTWDTATDLDLWIVDPQGETVAYFNPFSSSGGYLDRDNVLGFGPENIYWKDGAPDGDYAVIVDYFGCGEQCGFTSYSVSVSNGLGIVRSFNGSLEESGDQDGVITFTKEGKEILFN